MNRRKTKRTAWVVAAAWVLAGCGSSRGLHPGGMRPPGTDAPEPVAPAADTTTLPQSPAGQAGEGAPLTLAGRIDRLLVSADTLLQVAQLGLHVVDLSTGEVLYASGERRRMRPASAEKVVTAVAALDELGPHYEFSTRLMSEAPVSGHTLQGDLYVRGGMDPLLSVADVRTMVQQLKAAGITRVAGRLVADATMKNADEYGWGWCWDDENPVLSPLLCNGKPTLMDQVRTALKAAGITVAKGTATGNIQPGARELAAVRRPLQAVLAPMMKESDNLCAEAVFYQLGPIRPAVVTRLETVIARAGGTHPVTIADGSGLSLYNYQTPETFTRLLAYAAAKPDSILLPLLEVLPIAAVDGTLKYRMAGTSAAGNVRAKTGSVAAVSTLVGYTTQRSTGHLIAFAILCNGLPRLAEGRILQNQLCNLLSL